MREKHNIIFIGPEGSGKTEIFKRLATTKKFEPLRKKRMGLIPAQKIYPEKSLQIEYLDCGPNIESEQINPALLKASKICLVFEVTDKNWLQTIDNYLIYKHIDLPLGTQLLILGNKIDLLAEDQRANFYSAAESYASSKGATFVAYSAKENTHIDVLIDSLTTGLPVGLSSSSSGIPTRRASFSQRSIVSSTSNRQQLGKKVALGAASIEDLAQSDEDDTPNNGAGAGGLPSQQRKPEQEKQRTPIRTYSPNRARHRVDAVPPADTTLSFALRLAGMALMVAALVNAIYLLLIATNVFSAVALTAGMNHLLVSVGGLLGFAAPVTAFGNACAAIGLSTTAATGALSATGSLLMAVTGYSMFRCNPPVRSGLPPRDESILTSGHHDGRTSPPLVEKTYRW